jgi:hypothetical protein
MIKKIGSILQSRNASPEEVKGAYESVFRNANNCIQCGEVIPEGVLFCNKCKNEHVKSFIEKRINVPTVNDVVNHPAHYTDGKIEVIEFIEDKKTRFLLR